MKLYRLAFKSEQEAIDLQSKLQKSEENPDGYTALDIRGKQGATIKPAYTDDDGTEHDAEIDDRYFATVITEDDVKELKPYLVDVPYFPMRYGGEDKMEIVIL